MSEKEGIGQSKKTISNDDKKIYKKNSSHNNCKKKSKRFRIKMSGIKNTSNSQIKMNTENENNQSINAIDLISEIGSLSSSTLSSKNTFNFIKYDYDFSFNDFIILVDFHNQDTE
jgi:hypothetical protein